MKIKLKSVKVFFIDKVFMLNSNNGYLIDYLVRLGLCDFIGSFQKL
jgi:hypothetical protein